MQALSEPSQNFPQIPRILFDNPSRLLQMRRRGLSRLVVRTWFDGLLHTRKIRPEPSRTLS